MLELFNLFVVPTICVAVFYRRSEKSVIRFLLIKDYCVSMVAVANISFVVLKMSELSIGIGAEIDSQVYTLVATFVAFVLPYIYEVLKKYISIRCEIKINEE